MSSTKNDSVLSAAIDMFKHRKTGCAKSLEVHYSQKNSLGCL